jgi:hypothetical protein
MFKKNTSRNNRRSTRLSLITSMTSVALLTACATEISEPEFSLPYVDYTQKELDQAADEYDRMTESDSGYDILPQFIDDYGTLRAAVRPLLPES